MNEPTLSPLDIPKIAGLTVLIVVAAFILRPYISRPFVNAHIPSEPYVWPRGCKPARFSDSTPELGPHRYYSVEDDIPSACMDPRYYFPDAGRYNFPQQRGVQNWGRNYYRVGPDAINFNCFSDGKCVASDIVKDVFVEPGHSG
jgi:hypothetical protein